VSGSVELSQPAVRPAMASAPRYRAEDRMVITAHGRRAIMADDVAGRKM
jgi:hypothetical protein